MRRRRWLKALGPVALVAFVVVLNVAGFASEAVRERREHVAGLSVIAEPEDVYALAEWRGAVYAGGAGGLHRVDLDAREASPEDFGGALPHGHVRALLAEEVAGEDVLWVGSDKGLARVTAGGVRVFTTANGLPDDRIRDVERNGDELLVGTLGGLARFDGERFTILTEKDGLLSGVVNVVAVDAAGSVWMGSYDVHDAGLTVLASDGSVTTFTTADGLPHPSITCILPEADGTVWVGAGFFDKGGLARFSTGAGGRPAHAETYAAEDGLAGPKVRSLLRAPGGTLWIGSERDGLAVWRDGAAPRLLRTGQGLSDNEIKCFLPMGDGSVLLGTRGGITVVDAEAAMRL